MTDYDWEKIDDVALALLLLTLGTNGPFSVAKGFDRALLDRLHERGWISNPVGRSPWVYLSDEGLARAQQTFERHFRRAPQRSATAPRGTGKKRNVGLDHDAHSARWPVEKTVPSLRIDGLLSREEDTERGPRPQPESSSAGHTLPSGSQDFLI